MKSLEAKLIRLALKEYNKLDSVISRITERKPTKADREFLVGDLFDMMRFYKLLCGKYWQKAYDMYEEELDLFDWQWLIPKEIRDSLEDRMKPIWDKKYDS